jgi:hypothetical protein
MCVCQGFTLKVENNALIVGEAMSLPYSRQRFGSDLNHSRCDLKIFDDGTGIGIGDIRDNALKHHAFIGFDLKKCGLSVSISEDTPHMLLGFQNDCQILDFSPTDTE